MEKFFEELLQTITLASTRQAIISVSAGLVSSLLLHAEGTTGSERTIQGLLFDSNYGGVGTEALRRIQTCNK